MSVTVVDNLYSVKALVFSAYHAGHFAVSIDYFSNNALRNVNCVNVGFRMNIVVHFKIGTGPSADTVLDCNQRT